MNVEPNAPLPAADPTPPLLSFASVLRTHRFSFLPAWLLGPAFVLIRGDIAAPWLSPNAATCVWLALLVYALRKLWRVVTDTRVATHHVLIAWPAGTVIVGLLFLNLPTHPSSTRARPAQPEGMALPAVEPSAPESETVRGTLPKPGPEPRAQPRTTRPKTLDPLAPASTGGPSQQLATRLHVPGDGVVAGLRWQGYFSRRLSASEQPQEFRLRIFADHEGVPSASPEVDHVLTVTGRPTEFTTVENAPPVDRGVRFMEFEASFPSPARLDDAKPHWLSITTIRHGLWLWARAQPEEKPMVWFSAKDNAWKKSAGLSGSFAHSLQPAMHGP